MVSATTASSKNDDQWSCYGFQPSLSPKNQNSLKVLNKRGSHGLAAGPFSVSADVAVVPVVQDHVAGAVPVHLVHGQDVLLVIATEIVPEPPVALDLAFVVALPESVVPTEDVRVVLGCVEHRGESVVHGAHAARLSGNAVAPARGWGL